MNNPTPFQESPNQYRIRNNKSVYRCVSKNDYSGVVLSWDRKSRKSPYVDVFWFELENWGGFWKVEKGQKEKCCRNLKNLINVAKGSILGVSGVILIYSNIVNHFFSYIIGTRLIFCAQSVVLHIVRNKQRINS